VGIDAPGCRWVASDFQVRAERYRGRGGV